MLFLEGNHRGVQRIRASGKSIVVVGINKLLTAPEATVGYVYVREYRVEALVLARYSFIWMPEGRFIDADYFRILVLYFIPRLSVVQLVTPPSQVRNPLMTKA